MDYLLNDHEHHPNQHANSQKLCYKTGHPFLTLTESQWKLRQPDQNFPILHWTFWLWYQFHIIYFIYYIALIWESEYFSIINSALHYYEFSYVDLKYLNKYQHVLWICWQSGLFFFVCSLFFYLWLLVMLFNRAATTNSFCSYH